MTLVEELAAFAVAPAPPPEVSALVPLRVLDTLGVALGALPLPTSGAAIGFATDEAGAPEAVAIGARDRLPASSAAFVNGVLAHSLDYDDTHLPSILHPSASVVPTVLAAAQVSGAPGNVVSSAILAGLEICCRLGMAGYDREARNSIYFDRGQHATSICGAVAGAAGAAVALGATRDQVAHAMSIAVSMGAGVLEANRAGGTVKRLHCGLAARSAVTAARLALRGFTGPPTALEGRFGFFQAHLSGRFETSEVTGDLNGRWETARIATKPYPCNHFTHAAIDAAIGLRDGRGIDPGDIESVVLGVPGPTVRTIGEPIEVKRAPVTGYQAQFSGPYAVAAAFVRGTPYGLGLDDFTDALAADPRIRALMAKVSVEADPVCDRVYPDELPARLTVTMRDGKTGTVEVMTSLGGASRPMSEEDHIRKFEQTAGRVLAPDDVEIMIAKAQGLPAGDGVDGLLAPVTRAKEG